MRSMNAMQADQSALLTWYRAQKRDLPWRLDNDPYRIWISEAMLQQTTVAAVIPYYLRFLERFPNLRALATGSVEDVLEMWAGLGYYSRARNLHKSAQALAEHGFPQTFAALMQMPGFGPYTSRAVASLAFDQKVGVLDGNVIRVLSRRFGLATQWWKPRERTCLQEMADKLAQVDKPADWNQAMMELGATICTPTRPACLLCPWSKTCVARAEDRISQVPLRRPRRAREIWAWRPQVLERDGAVALVKNDYAPFLRGHWVCPGAAERLSKPPLEFDYRASVTHHDIFVILDKSEDNSLVDQQFQSPHTKAAAATWVPRKDLKKWTPASLIAKAFAAASKHTNATLTLVCLIAISGCSSGSGLNSASGGSTGLASGPGAPATVDVSEIKRFAALTGGPLATPLTASGDCSQASFSPDGARVLFLSANRIAHKNAQIYELSTKTRLERRVTYHDGEDSDPSYRPDGSRVLYASTTDEIKEDPRYLTALRNRIGGPVHTESSLSPSELYLATLDGGEIKRITISSGYDAEGHFDPQGKRIAFVTSRYGKSSHTQIIVARSDGLEDARIANGVDVDSAPAFSPDGKQLAFVRRGVDGLASHIMVADLTRGAKARLITETAAQDVQPIWHPNGRELIFSSNRADGSGFDIWTVTVDGAPCFKRLTDAAGNETQPAIGSDGMKLLFTGDQNGHKQIYLIPYAPPKACTPD